MGIKNGPRAWWELMVGEEARQCVTEAQRGEPGRVPIFRPAFLSAHSRGSHALFQNIRLAGSLVPNLAYDGCTVWIL